MNMRTIAAANVWILLAATAVAQAATKIGRAHV